MSKKKVREEQRTYWKCRNCGNVLGGSVLAEQHCLEEKHELERVDKVWELIPTDAGVQQNLLLK